MSDAKSKLDALKAAFDKKASGGGGGDQSWKLFYPFWKMPDDGLAVVRFLPDLDENNNLGFLIEKHEHELIINGNRKKVPCLQMWGEKCPICDLSRKYYDEKNNDMGKKYYRKKSYIGQIIVIESPIEHDQSQLVKLVEFGPQVFTQIQEAFKSGDLDEAPYELKGGYNFRFRKTKTGDGRNSYSASKFATKQTDLDDEIIEALNLYNLDDYKGQKPERAVVEALLVADQTGQNVDEDSLSETPKNQAETPVAVKSTPKEEQAPKEETPEASVKNEAPAEDGAKKGSILDQLRQRAKAAALAE